MTGMDRVDEAFRAHPRAGFLPAELHARAHEDRPLPIGHGQTSSQPSTVAAMLRLLDVPPGARVLDVGAGSGWTTALLGHLVGPEGTVHGVELEPDLAAWGAANQPAGQPWARELRADPTVLGLPAAGPYDRILVSAEARELPQALVDQLAAGGRMVLPVRGEMLLVERARDGGLRTTAHGGYRFVPLR
ncbi:protein-L-isoaspartate O-methyltransferase [Actinotalea sp. BY-33]|uniref:Protein-L-isoaspartate O-methyltransferase n=1 Tax=Actinotalea soli TaxID=2819234 RepID=A0A939LR70_9CELL|nr:protein-L-isoaspartate O-methyltransferase [Actinotalea soli]MBO1753001.1 protein-L-isoaspartate O-methyltransferase [Actinotalea soli]